MSQLDSEQVKTDNKQAPKCRQNSLAYPKILCRCGPKIDILLFVLHFHGQLQDWDDRATSIPLDRERYNNIIRTKHDSA